MNIYLDLFLTFFKVGLFTFGGGASMIPIIQQEVFSHGWLSDETLIKYIAIGESTPGPIAVNIATFVGSSQGGFLGAVIATLGIVLPSFIIILIVAMFFKKFLEYKGVQTTLKTIRPIVVGMILAVGAYFIVSSIGIKSFEDVSVDFTCIIITAILGLVMLAYKLITKKSIPVIAFILVSACVGILVTYLSQIIVA